MLVLWKYLTCSVEICFTVVGRGLFPWLWMDQMLLECMWLVLSLFLGWACVKLDLCYWISWLGRLLTASLCIKGVTCIWFNCKATLLGVWPDWAELPAGAGKGWFWCWHCPWPKEQDAGRAQWRAVAMSRIQPVFSLWHYSLLASVCLVYTWSWSWTASFPLLSLLKGQIWWGARQHILSCEGRAFCPQEQYINQLWAVSSRSKSNISQGG